MRVLERLVEASRRLDQAVYRRLGIGRLAAAIAPKIPPRLRKAGANYVPVISGILVVALFAAALWRLDQSQLRTASSGTSASSPGPTSAPGEGITSPDLQAPSTKSGATSSSARGSSKRRGSGTAVGTGSAAATGRAITDSTITIGFVAFKGLAEIRTGARGGECGGDCGDNGKQIEAAVNYINAQGGVAKRKVVPVIHWMDLRRADTFDVWAQEACTDFTEDHKVWAVVDVEGSGFYEEQLVACLAPRGVPRIGFTERDQKVADDYAPYWYAPSFLNQTRGGRVQVLGLLKQGFFEQGAKIGLVGWDTPSDRRAAEQGHKRTLAAQGLKLTDEAAVSYLARLSDYSVIAAQAGNAALRFRSNGITHVLFQDRSGGLAWFFMDNAETQGYRPRYGLSSFSSPRSLMKVVPSEQLRQVRGVGWLTMTDVGDLRIPPPNASTQVCIDIMKKAGLPSPELDQKGLSYCDGLFFLKLAVDDAKALTIAGFQAAAEGLGKRFEPLLTFTARFGPGHHDGASAWRPFAFDDGCNCFSYVGGLDPID